MLFSDWPMLLTICHKIDSDVALQCALANKMVTASCHFRSVCEEDLDEVWNDW